MYGNTIWAWVDCAWLAQTLPRRQQSSANFFPAGYSDGIIGYGGSFTLPLLVFGLTTPIFSPPSSIHTVSLHDQIDDRLLRSIVDQPSSRCCRLLHSGIFRKKAHLLTIVSRPLLQPRIDNDYRKQVIIPSGNSQRHSCSISWNWHFVQVNNAKAATSENAPQQPIIVT